VAFFDTTWYVSSVAYAAVTVRPQNTAVAAGVVRRQFTAPAVNSERCFVCIVAGTTANVTDATWSLTRGAKTTDGTATWQEVTGMAAVNGDVTNTPTWASASPRTPSLGVIIKRNSGASYQICTSAGTMQASEPAFSDTAGVTTNDGTVIWTSLGPVGNFPAWGAPHARLANAYTVNWGVAGNRFYVADNHAETQATTLSFANPANVTTAPTYTICVDRTAALPPVEANYNTGASFTTTGTSPINFNFATNFGFAYYQGLAFSSGDGAGLADLTITGASGGSHFFKNCAFAIGGTNASTSFKIGNPGGSAVHVLWDNCTVKFGAVGQTCRPQSVNFEWRNTSSAIQGATLPTSLFSTLAGVSSYMVCRGVDFSAFSGQLLASNSPSTVPIVFEDCKFNASMTRYGASNTVGYAGTPLVTVRCDSGATNYKSTRDEYSGSQITETSITRVGGATDGTTPQSTKIVTNAQAAFLTPYRMLRLAQWNDVTGANRTVTVCGTINSASLPLNDEIWMDVQYLGSSSSPIASFKSTCKSHPLATGAAVASDGSTWNGVSGGDTYFSNVKLLMGFNGTNGSTGAPGMTDESSAAHGTATVSGASTISTAQSVFGGSSLNTTGSDYVYFADHADWNLSNSPFTIEFRFRPTSLGSNQFLVGQWGAGGTLGWEVWLTSASRLSWSVSTTGSDNLNDMVGSTSLANNTWYAACVDYDGTKYRMYIDGVMVASSTTARTIFNSTNNLVLGASNASAFFYIGYMDELRITNGVARYASDAGYTIATTAFPRVGGVYTPFKLVATLTSPQPQMKGYIYVSVRAAKASTTYYIDPQITLS
jgi:Concanavalin A-like lectin/glucanases superfamily